MNFADNQTLAVDPEVRRTLSPAERWYWILDQVSPLNIVSWASIPGQIPDGLFEQAAQVLRSRHPLLRVSVEAKPDGTQPTFVSAPSTNLRIRRIAAVDDRVLWKQAMAGTELSTPLDPSSGCMVRITEVVHDAGALAEMHVVVLTLSHVIGDAVSATTLLAELIEIAGELSVGQASAIDREPGPPVISSRALLAPDRSLPRSHRGAVGLARVFLSVVEQLRQARQRPVRLVAREEVPHEDRATRIVSRTISGVDFQKLSAACDAHSVQLRSAVTVALAWAIRRLNDGSVSGRVCIGVGDDTRKAVAPGADDLVMGAYTTLSPTLISYGPVDEFWSRVLEVDHSSSCRIDRGDHITPLLSMQFISPPSVGKSANAVKMAEQRGPGNVMHVSVRTDSSSASPWEVSPLEFAVSLSATGLLGACTTVSDSSLQWNTVFAERVVAAADAESVADSASALLLAVL